MYNFTHKPCCTDSDQAQTIAKNIKEIAEQTHHNPLKFLLSKNLDNLLLVKIELSEINDFVRLKKKDLIEKIYFGKFQLRQASSYVGELIKSGVAYSLTNECIAQIDNISLRSELLKKKSKIIGIEIVPRNKRKENKPNENNATEISSNEQDLSKFKTTYKVFILYDPSDNTTTSITGF
jgi:hypothetical protein